MPVLEAMIMNSHTNDKTGHRHKPNNEFQSVSQSVSSLARIIAITKAAIAEWIGAGDGRKGEKDEWQASETTPVES